MRRRWISRTLATAFVALVGAVAVGGVAFGVQLALAKPPRTTRLGADMIRVLRQNRAVYSAGWLGGRRVGALCKTIGTERWSQVALADGRQGIVSWRAGRMFHRPARHLGQLRNEVLLAGCSGQTDRLLNRQLRLATNAGRPLRIAPAVFDGKPALRIRVDVAPRLTYLFFDPETLVPVGVFLKTPSLTGRSVLAAEPWLHAHKHRRGLH